MNDELVIADLAEDNPNVFYELAIRHVTKKPCIQLKEPNQKLPFDIADTRTIDLNTSDLESVEKAKESLKGHLDSVGEETPNPITVAVDNLVLQGSKNPITNSLSEIMRALSEIRVAISGTEKMTIDQEMTIRQKEDEITAQQLRQPIGLLDAAIMALNNNDKLPIELKEEVKKINDATQSLHRIQTWLTATRQRYLYGKAMNERMNEKNRMMAIQREMYERQKAMREQSAPA
jgi:hypothetical protein